MNTEQIKANGEGSARRISLVDKTEAAMSDTMYEFLKENWHDSQTIKLIFDGVAKRLAEAESTAARVILERLMVDDKLSIPQKVTIMQEIATACWRRGIEWTVTPTVPSSMPGTVTQQP